jgi:hypothetical protein
MKRQITKSDARRSTLTEGQVWCAPELGLLDALEDIIVTASRVVRVIHADDGLDYDETARAEHVLAELFVVRAQILLRTIDKYRCSILRRINEPSPPDPFSAPAFE